MFHRLLTLALVLSFVPSSLAATCDSCTARILCPAHKEAETAALAAANAGMRAKDEATRVRALEAVASLTKAHENAPSKTVAKFLAAGIRDESLAVRRTAVSLLASGQEPGESLKGVLQALEDAKKELADVKADKEAVGAYVRVVLAAASGMRDDRSVKGLADFLSALPTDSRYVLGPEVCEALLALGSRDAVEAVIGFLAEVERYGRGTPIHNALAAFAEKGGLGGAPAAGPTASSAWRKWLKGKGKEVPAKLGKVST